MIRLPSTRSVFHSCLALALGTFSSGALHAQVGTSGWTERVSFAADGSQVTEHARFPSMSGNGRFVAYATEDALLPGDDNGERDVYVYDRLLGTLVCASTNIWGEYGDGESSYPSMSDNGRWVAFHTDAKNLGGIDVNNHSDVYVRDLWDWKIYLVSRITGGVGTGNSHSAYPSVSADGRYIAYQTYATNLAPGDTNGSWDIYVHDRVNNTQRRAGIGWDGDEPNGSSRRPSISANGRRVAYHSSATNLAFLENNDDDDVFVHDFDTNNTIPVSYQPGAGTGNGNSFGASISADGQGVAFLSASTNFDPKDTDPSYDAYYVEVATFDMELVSVTYLGGSATSGTDLAGLARGGRYALFSTNTPMLPGDNHQRDVYIRDLLLNKTWLVSRPDGAVTLSDSHSFAFSASANGREVAFESWGTFDPADTNERRDIYVRTMIPDPFDYCSSQTTAEECIAKVDHFGFPSARTATGFTVYAEGVPLDRPGLLFYGFKGGAEIPFGGGVLCLSGPLKRSIVLTSGNTGIGPCDGMLSIDMNAFAAGHLGGNPHALLAEAGQQVNVQFWGRDWIGGGGSYLTEALQYVVGP